MYINKCYDRSNGNLTSRPFRKSNDIHTYRQTDWPTYQQTGRRVCLPVYDKTLNAEGVREILLDVFICQVFSVLSNRDEKMRYECTLKFIVTRLWLKIQSITFRFQKLFLAFE